MTDNEIYLQVYKVAKKAVLNKYLRIDFDDLVNDAYVATAVENKEFNFENLSKNVNKEAQKYLNANSSYNEDRINNLQTSFCRCCKEDKPIGAFGVTVRKKTGKKIVQTYCNECQTEKMRLYRRSKGVKEKKELIYEYPSNCITVKQRQAYRHKIWQRINIIHIYNYRKNRISDKSISMPGIQV